MKSDDRITELEHRFTLLDDTVEQLNDSLVQQSLRIERLERSTQKLADLQEQWYQTRLEDADKPPPHY